MPNFDGTGPLGTGPIGRGVGPCRRMGDFRRANFGTGFRRKPLSKDEELSILEETEKALLDEISAVRSEKKSLQGQK